LGYGEPYYYVRLNPWRDDKDILIAGGEDHRSGEANDAERRFANLEVWTHERFPQLEGIYSINRNWKKKARRGERRA
jgi:hypothetical protein